MKKFVIAISALLCVGLFTQEFATNPAPAAALPSLAPIIKQAMPAIVNIQTQGDLPPDAPTPNDNQKQPDPNQGKDRKFAGLGSGVILDPAHGYVITNAHVVRDAKIINVTLSDGRHFKAKLIGADMSSDIAVIQITASDLVGIPLADSNQVRVGDFVVAIGNPFGLSTFGTNQTATFGIVSALKRSDIRIEGVENFIQTDAAINPGNSGGALINVRGQLIGINTAIISPYGGNVGIGLAIPVNMAHSVMEQIIKYGSVHRGLMGIFVQHLTPELAEAFGVPNEQGALITQVNPGSPAESAGLKPGDIISEINGEVITDAAEVKNIIGLLRVGSTVHMKILRGGKAINLTAEVADIRHHEEKLQAQNPFLFGLALRDFDQENPLQGHVQGVQVVGLSETSAGWRSGLRPGDVIVSANHVDTKNYVELQKAATNAKQSLLVHILRDMGSLYLLIK